MAEVSSTTSTPSTTTTSTSTNTKANTSKTGIMGLGSNNKLNDETLDKLKAADSAAIIDPITRKIDKNTAQKEDLGALIGLAKNLSSSFSSLTDETNYLKRQVTSTGTSASVAAVTGVAIQDISLNVQQLAQRDSFQSEKFSSQLSLIGIASDSSFDIEIRGVKYTIDLKPSSTYQDLADLINEKAGGDVQARMINVGNGYQMVLQSKYTGAENSMKLTSTSGDALEKLGWDSKTIPVKDDTGAAVLNPDGTPKTTTNLEKNRLTTASDAKFEYNGLQITRKNNTFDDLRSGVTITLKETGASNFSIGNDTSELLKAVETMMGSYNNFLAALEIGTKYDDKTGESGQLQGVNEVTSIRSTLHRIFTSQDSNGNSITDFGITIGEDGKLAFIDPKDPTKTSNDASVFLSKLNSNHEAIKNFFMGFSKIEPISYTGTSDVSAGSVELKSGDLTINGISVKLAQTNTNATAKENALALLKAINSAGILGVEATLSSDQKRIMLKASDGSDIEIKGNNSVLAKFGMSENTIRAKTTNFDGLFTKMSDQLDKLVGSNGSLTIYDKKLADDNKKLTDEREKAQTNLDDKYKQMRDTWSKYDTLIAKLENQFATLKAMIDAEMKKKD
ncbi:flagellar filament capping protein FliD [Campylobacter mucosalis]|uniref:Flagellar hook-associated protein 2 n=1 Tax=Campylobacter mucosalis CCUG 21559 TaxID=1032067 RepID=A0A6G5QHG6_9BACT|nr:flagellar filament capping protein FliD [Campylobacter mucosalis]QCD45072.1 flagellar filament cap protein [Campylobacter mucosalis CCUG 21559]